MKNVLATLIFLSTISVAEADQCKSWGHKAYPVTMEACSNSDGGSGYYRITNDGSQAANICWSVVSNDGSKDDSCNSNLGAGESTRGSCFDCGAKNSGVRYILLESYKPAL